MRAQPQQIVSPFAIGCARNHDREIKFAPGGRRALAWCVDQAVVCSLAGVLLCSQVWSAGAWPPHTSAALILAWVLLPTCVAGKSLGQWLLSLRVIRTDGHSLGWSERIMRDLLGRGLIAGPILLMPVLATMLGAENELPAAIAPLHLDFWLRPVAWANLVWVGVSGIDGVLRPTGRRRVKLLVRVYVVDVRPHVACTLRLMKNRRFA